MTSLLVDSVSGVRVDSHDDRLPSSSSSSSSSSTRQPDGLYAGLSRSLGHLFATPLKFFRPPRLDALVIVQALSNSRLSDTNQNDGAAESGRRQQSGQSSSRWRLIKDTVRKNGLRKLPTQILPPLIANSLLGVTLFSAYDLTVYAQHSWLGETYLPSSLKSCFVAGSIAGAAHAVVSCPVDGARIRIEVDGALAFSSVARNRRLAQESFVSYVRRIWNEHSLSSLYRGFLLTLLKDSFCFGIFFASFDAVKSMLCVDSGKLVAAANSYSNSSAFVKGDINQDERIDSRFPKRKKWTEMWVEPLKIVAAGSVASVAYQICTHPLDMVRTLLIVQQQDHRHRSSAPRVTASTKQLGIYRACWQDIKRIVRTERGGSWYRFFYHNFQFSVLSSIPPTALGLLALEYLRARSEED